MFAQRQLEYLGHIISSNGIQVDPSKVQSMTDWLIPTSIAALHSFMGLTDFYRKFIKGYATIVSPITSLLKKDAFLWNPEAQLAFDNLKTAMTQAHVLALTNFSIPFDIEPDASGMAMGIMLLQKTPHSLF